MIQLIALIFLLISILGMSFLFYKKKREINGKEELEEVSSERILPELQIKERINQIPYIKDMDMKHWLKKFLVKIKIFFLKCENKVDHWLNRVSHSKNFDDDYWDKIQKQGPA